MYFCRTGLIELSTKANPFMEDVNAADEEGGR